MTGMMIIVQLLIDLFLCLLGYINKKIDFVSIMICPRGSLEKAQAERSVIVR